MIQVTSNSDFCFPQLTPYWKKLRYHPSHNAIWNCDKRHIVVVAGRRSGKTQLAKYKMALSLAVKKPWPNPTYAFCCPTYKQAKQVIWKEMIELIPDNWLEKDGVHVSDMCITTIFGSMLYVVGLDKPKRLEGLALDGAIIDECSDQRPEAFKLSILPALMDRNGWSWRIGVPKRTGIGKVAFREAYDRGQTGEDPHVASFHWKSSSVLTEEQLEASMSEMTQEDFDEQYNAAWIDAGGTIYYAFTDENVDENADYNKETPIDVGSDFNVDPMCWTLSHSYGDRGVDKKVDVFDQVYLKNTNTEAALDNLHKRYGEHEAGWRFYGDASGRNRHPNSSKTDYILIKNDKRFKNSKVIYPQKNPPVRDRFATVNAGLCNAKKERRVKIHPRCERLIRDFKEMAYQEGTTEPENYRGTQIGHMSDGFGYMMFRVMPLNVTPSAAPAVMLGTPKGRKTTRIIHRHG